MNRDELTLHLLDVIGTGGKYKVDAIRPICVEVPDEPNQCESCPLSTYPGCDDMRSSLDCIASFRSIASFAAINKLLCAVKTINRYIERKDVEEL